ncbi:MAG TPA: hypothetical protein VFD03_10400 [Clostridia bacterium]|nr:hypothetical protein [Clostridia bacterium]
MKKTLVIFLVLTMGLMVGCTSKKAVNPVDAYLMVIDKLYTADSLSSNIKYLYIDTSLM